MVASSLYQSSIRKKRKRRKGEGYDLKAVVRKHKSALSATQPKHIQLLEHGLAKAKERVVVAHANDKFLVLEPDARCEHCEVLSVLYIINWCRSSILLHELLLQIN